MENHSPSGLQDDEALLTYLIGGKEPLRWQLVYRQFKAAQPHPSEATVFAKAFATWLDDLREGHFTRPLHDSLFATFQAYLNCIAQLPQVTGPTKLPPYLAGDVLVAALRKDNTNTHNALVISYREPAQAILNQRQPIAASDFADAYQNAQLGLLEKPPPGDAPLTAQLFSWFMRVLIRRVIDGQRKLKKTSLLPAEDLATLRPTEKPTEHDTDYLSYLNERYQINERFGSDDTRDVVKKALDQLEGGCRDLIRQRYIFNYAYRKIADQNDYSVDSVGQRIKRCLKKLREIMTAN